MKTYHVCRVLRNQNGTSLVATIGVAIDDKIAQTITEEEAAFMSDIAKCMVVAETPQGPRAVMPVSHLLIRLGINGGTGVMTETVEVKESSLVQVKPGPLLGSNGQPIGRG